MSTITAALETTAIRVWAGGSTWLHADIATPPDAQSLVLFVHDSGSNRHSGRNRYVASDLNARCIATVLVDLLTEEEAAGRPAADVSMLTRRVVQIVDWARTYDLVGTLPLGLFGAGTGAAAALDAAAQRPRAVAAIVSRGGRLELAQRLGDVRAPTLLIAGANDATVLQTNSAALKQLRCVKELEIVSGATHLFEEPGALEAVASATGAWFQRYLRTASGAQS